MLISLQRLINLVFFVILATLTFQPARPEFGWLNSDPNLIWNRSPGFSRMASDGMRSSTSNLR